MSLIQTVIQHMFSWRDGRWGQTRVRVEDGVAYVSCHGVTERIVVREGSEVVIVTRPVNADVLMYQVTLETKE